VLKLVSEKTPKVPMLQYFPAPHKCATRGKHAAVAEYRFSASAAYTPQVVSKIKIRWYNGTLSTRGGTLFSPF
jgi:hypothetical protein